VCAAAVAGAEDVDVILSSEASSGRSRPEGVGPVVPAVSCSSFSVSLLVIGTASRKRAAAWGEPLGNSKLLTSSAVSVLNEIRRNELCTPVGVVVGAADEVGAAVELAIFGGVRIGSNIAESVPVHGDIGAGESVED
jgi:hypothetical protein